MLNTSWTNLWTARTKLKLILILTLDNLRAKFPEGRHIPYFPVMCHILSLSPSLMDQNKLHCNDCMRKDSKGLPWGLFTHTHTHTHTHTETVSVKGTDCYSDRMDNKHAGKVSFAPSVNGFPSGLPINDVPSQENSWGLSD